VTFGLSVTWAAFTGARQPGDLAAALLRRNDNRRASQEAYARDLANWFVWLDRAGVRPFAATLTSAESYVRQSVPNGRTPAPATVARRMAGLSAFDRRVAYGDHVSLAVAAALRTDDVIDLLGHQLRQHPEADADAQRRQPFLRTAGTLAERHLHAFGQRVELPIAALGGRLIYVPPGGAPRLTACSHWPRSQQDRTRRGRTHLKFREPQNNFPGRM
jgi:hypothetical protein